MAAEAGGAGLTLIARRAHVPWSQQLDDKFEYGRSHANFAWGSVHDDPRCGSISRAHLKIVPESDGISAWCTCLGQRVRVRSHGEAPMILERGNDPIRIHPGTILDLTIKTGTAGESTATLLERLPAHRWSNNDEDGEMYFSLELKLAPATANAAAEPAPAAPSAVFSAVPLAAAPVTASGKNAPVHAGSGIGRVRSREASPSRDADGAPPAKQPSTGDASPYTHAAIIARLLSALPSAERRLKEPVPLPRHQPSTSTFATPPILD